MNNSLVVDMLGLKERGVLRETGSAAAHTDMACHLGTSDWRIDQDTGQDTSEEAGSCGRSHSMRKLEKKTGSVPSSDALGSYP